MSAFAKQIAKVIKEHKTAAGAAKAVYRECRLFAVAAGMNPDSEVSIKKPGEPRHHDHTDCWSVVFEAGPYEWAVEASMEGGNAHVYAEPYYSFDLSFYQSKVN